MINEDYFPRRNTLLRYYSQPNDAVSPVDNVEILKLILKAFKPRIIAFRPVPSGPDNSGVDTTSFFRSINKDRNNEGESSVSSPIIELMQSIAKCKLSNWKERASHQTAISHF